MADEISIESLKEFFDKIKDPSLGDFIKNLESTGQKITTIGDLAKNVSAKVVQGFKDQLEAAKNLLSTFGKYQEEADAVGKAASAMWDKMTAGMNKYVTQQKLAGRGTEFFSTQALLGFDAIIGKIPSTVTGMGNLGQAGYDAGRKISEGFKDIAPLFGSIQDQMMRFAEGASNAYALQTELIRMAAAQGRLGELTAKSGKSFKDLNALTAQQIDLAHKSAVETGNTVSTMLNLQKALSPIPGTMGDMILVGDKRMNQEVVATQIATRFGRTHEEIAKTLNEAYTSVGLSGSKAYETVALLFDQAEDSKLRFDDFNKTVFDIAGTFKMFGDNTESVTRIVGAFDRAFKDSDISPAAMQEVIKNMSAGVQGMNEAQLAFVSSQTGGPGGLAGAFELEQLISEGNVAEVMKRTSEAIRAQFGGEVLTREDVMANQNLAGEYYRQRQFVQNIPGIAKSGAEAERVLEAMKTGVFEGLTLGAPEERKQVLVSATDIGFKEQMRTTSPLLVLKRELEVMKLLQANQLGQLNTSMNESVGIQQAMLDSMGYAGTAGMVEFATNKAEAGARIAAPETMEDVIEDTGKRWLGTAGQAFDAMGVNVRSMLSPLMKIGEKQAKKGDFGSVREEFIAAEAAKTKKSGKTEGEEYLEGLRTAPVGTEAPTGMEEFFPVGTEVPTDIEDYFNNLRTAPVELPPPLGGVLPPPAIPLGPAGIAGPLGAFEGELPRSLMFEPAELRVSIDLGEPFNRRVDERIDMKIKDAAKTVRGRQSGTSIGRDVSR